MRRFLTIFAGLFFFIGCGDSNNTDFTLGSLEIIDNGPVASSSWETHMAVDSGGKLTGIQYTVENGIVTGTSSTWEYQMTADEKSLVEQECTDAQVLYQGDITLPDGAEPCTGAGDLVFHAISGSGQENRFTVSGAVRCDTTGVYPETVKTLYATMNGWTPAMAGKVSR